MGKFYDCVPEELVPWIKRQQMFFVATAPLSASGHVNLSPKGLRGTLHIVDKTRVWYEDLSGSGVETISHLRENGRITIIFCAFEGAARIVRLFGIGKVFEFGTPEYFELIPPEQRLSGSRAAIVVDVHKANSSCGYAVPLYTFKQDRSTLLKWSDKILGDDTNTRVYPERSMKWWWAKTNLHSIDGLPGLHSAHITDAVPRATVHLEGAGEPPSDGTVVVLGNRIPKETMRALLVPASREEVVRLVLAVTLGVTVAAVYVQVVGLRGC
ncbi:hypothetical protein K466DRAFT_500243 [Polyporus arcularius HHB13444]|uniref:Pyridoxamine 5'-phosphate oxidase N-terminal domain-containing protein n=1 Tax=Polyporus arcularius HHB13444 TaxID=1314778 RepID=A0A5C3P0D9_9APHY|nr:hypothetical protein K466DRAFT_500243 [Polyporus arcularius HHB13444]